MLKLSVGKGRQVIKQLCSRVLQYYATVATERAGYVLYRAVVMVKGHYVSGILRLCNITSPVAVYFSAVMR